ncbi:general transcription factor IIH subunit 5 [Chelonoidis abingdonii]|uniref:general transcription factor IIH subunit 5 n=1 Tax=Chelonoidis abingdonii TaxID=106734 RepID=UPI0013F1BE56|nr:general transcription factor IIH subunit 5 [Chelonoidis abingdonii]
MRTAALGLSLFGSLLRTCAAVGLSVGCSVVRETAVSSYKRNPKQDLFSLSATSGLSKCVEKMVNVLKGVLIECDPAMKQFLLYLDESNALGKKFIIQDLDETHVFVLAELVNFLQERVGELMDQNSFPITQK